MPRATCHLLSPHLGLLQGVDHPLVGVGVEGGDADVLHLRQGGGAEMGRTLRSAVRRMPGNVGAWREPLTERSLRGHLCGHGRVLCRGGSQLGLCLRRVVLPCGASSKFQVDTACNRPIFAVQTCKTCWRGIPVCAGSALLVGCVQSLPHLVPVGSCGRAHAAAHRRGHGVDLDLLTAASWYRICNT